MPSAYLRWLRYYPSIFIPFDSHFNIRTIDYRYAVNSFGVLLTYNWSATYNRLVARPSRGNRHLQFPASWLLLNPGRQGRSSTFLRRHLKVLYARESIRHTLAWEMTQDMSLCSENVFALGLENLVNCMYVVYS